MLRNVTGGGGSNLNVPHDVEAIKVVKDDRTLRRKDDKSETEVISRHSEENNDFIPKNLVTANTEVYPSKSSLIEGRLMLQEVVHDNNFNSSETDHASMPLRIFASKSVSLKRTAFTLAEILITLGIIGVVAAITMPVVIDKIQKLVLKNQFSKAYNTLIQAWKKSEYDLDMTHAACFYWSKNPYGQAVYNFDEKGNVLSVKLANGDPLPSDYNGKFQDCTPLWQQMKKNLKIIKTCDSKAFEKGCIPLYKGREELILMNNPEMSDIDLKKAVAGCTDSTKQNIQNNWNAFVLNDGTIFFSSENDAKYFAIDVNGMKGPNKWGYDVFTFIPVGSPQIGVTYFTHGCQMKEKGGLLTQEMIASFSNKINK